MVSEKGKRRGLVLGCGGTLGAAWTIAALLEIERTLRWDARTATVIVGTSAGAELAALLGTGVSVTAILDAALGAASADPALVRHFASPPASYPPWPGARFRPARSARLALRSLRARLPVLGPTPPAVPWLVALAALVPEGKGDADFLDALVDARVPKGAWASHPAVYVVAVDLERGTRVAFGKDSGVGAIAHRPSLRDAVRASWAIPGWFPPVMVDGRRYVDGGVASPTSLDLLVDEGLDEVVVVAPMASREQGVRRGLGRAEGVVRRAMTTTLDAEVEQLEASGVRVTRVEPTAEELVAMGPHFMDGTRRLSVLEASLRSTRKNFERGWEGARP